MGAEPGQGCSAVGEPRAKPPRHHNGPQARWAVSSAVAPGVAVPGVVVRVRNPSLELYTHRPAAVGRVTLSGQLGHYDAGGRGSRACTSQPRSWWPAASAPPSSSARSRMPTRPCPPPSRAGRCPATGPNSFWTRLCRQDRRSARRAAVLPEPSSYIPHVGVRRSSTFEWQSRQVSHASGEDTGAQHSGRAVVEPLAASHYGNDLAYDPITL